MATKNTPRPAETTNASTSATPARPRRTLILVISIATTVLVAGVLYVLQMSQAATCGANDKLVNPCRPWIGATSAGYGVGSWKAHIEYLEKRAGRRLDIVHSYHRGDNTALTADEVSFINRGTMLYMNWKPDAYWKTAAGGNSTVNARIDKMANSIKTIAPKKIFLTVYAEPENDISKGGSSCDRHKGGNKGTTADYRAMWKNVRKRFDAKGVKNVVWVMNYMGWSGWDCAVKDMWPGNDLVDWITWDPYTGDNGSFNGDISRFYNFLSSHTDAAHAFTSKPWGIGEMGYEGANQSKAYKYYDDMAQAIKDNKFPRMKMYMFFDMNGKDFGGDPSWDSRIRYTKSGKVDDTEQQHFNSMLKIVQSLSAPIVTPTPTPTPTSTPTPPADNTPPTISNTTPKNGDTVKGKITFKPTATDNVKVTAVSLIADSKWVMTDDASPYVLTLDTTKYKNGQHKIILRAWDAAQHHTDLVIMLNIKN